MPLVSDTTFNSSKNYILYYYIVVLFINIFILEAEFNQSPL